LFISAITMPPPLKPPPKPKNLKFVRATFAYIAKESDELTFNEGDLLYILDWTSDPSWWKARCRGKEGLVPSNYLTSPTAGMAASELTELNPLHDACKRGNLDLLEECFLNRVPVNIPDKAGNTGLHWAARGGHEVCVERLLQLGLQIDVNCLNRLGDTPLHLAAKKGAGTCIDLLRSTERVELFKKNNDGQTAFDLATAPEAKLSLKRWERSLIKTLPSNMNDQNYEQSDED
jgi:ankyrin repeat protein